jgi:hypothetical protein
MTTLEEDGDGFQFEALEEQLQLDGEHTLYLPLIVK